MSMVDFFEKYVLLRLLKIYEEFLYIEDNYHFFKYLSCDIMLIDFYENNIEEHLPEYFFDETLLIDFFEYISYDTSNISPYNSYSEVMLNFEKIIFFLNSYGFFSFDIFTIFSYSKSFNDYKPSLMFYYHNFLFFFHLIISLESSFNYYILKFITSIKLSPITTYNSNKINFFKIYTDYIVSQSFFVTLNFISLNFILMITDLFKNYLITTLNFFKFFNFQTFQFFFKKFKYIIIPDNLIFLT